MSQLSTSERIELIKSITVNGGELIGESELEKILTSGEKLYTYDGFEPSGQMHIAQGIIRAINVNKMISAGFTFRMWVADWFGYLNNKMGGDLEKIKTVGKYFVEIWKASGMNLDGTEFLWTSDFVGERWYWELVMKIGKAVTLKRALRTTAIMGRSESDDLSAGQIFYPCMQVADIFGVMKAQVTQLGLDQQKVNILAREVGEELGYWKPVIVSHGMLQGLQKPEDKKRFETKISSNGKDRVELLDTVIYKTTKVDVKVKQVSTTVVMLGFVDKNGTEVRDALVKIDESVKFFDMESKLFKDSQGDISLEILEGTQDRMISMKMSKSKPNTAIFMTDTEEEVKAKIMKAYCPEGVVEENPILDYCNQIIFNANYLKREAPLLEDGKFVVLRKPEYGGDVSFSNYAELAQYYAEKKLFPLDLKNAVVGYINKLLQPVRDHFENDATAKEILAKVKSYEVVR